jgi:hypothetical protein
MLKQTLRTPRLQHPLPAVLVSAGFFVFLAVLGQLGPIQRWDQSLWRASEPAPAEAAALPGALRLLGAPQSLSPAARALALAEDVAWLRAHGAGAIVVEAWLDEAPQAEARALEADLRRRLEGLKAGRTQRAAMAALNEAAISLDASQRLAQALQQAQPLLLAFSVVPGQGQPLPPALTLQAYEVSLHGKRQALPAYQPLHLPFDDALNAVGRAGAVPEPGAGDQRAAVVEVDGHWFNALGLEAARLALGLPLEALRYRWKQGRLSSLELKGLRYPLDAQGRLTLAGPPAPLEAMDWERLKSDAVLQQQLRGRTVFYRPWPKLLGGAESFDQQQQLFSAVVGREVLSPAPEGWQRLAWLGLMALGVLALAWWPALWALLAWAVLPIYSLWAFTEEPGALVQPWGLALSGLLLGLAWRLHRRMARQAEALSLLHGRTAESHHLAWRQRLGSGRGSLDGAYALVGPRQALQGAPWEAWMVRWGALVDDSAPADGIGLVLPEPTKAPLALMDLREALPISAGMALGTLSFELGQHLGAAAWQWRGPSREEALALFRISKQRQILILERDYPAWREQAQVQLLGMDSGGIGGQGGGQLLNLLARVDKV